MITTKLRAFHGDPKIKAKYIRRVRAHAKADEIISGKYWENGKGCAVGCTIHGSDHNTYECQLGIPNILARLEDRLFEGLYATGSVKEAKVWPERFLDAAKPGADLSLVWPKFAVWLLGDPSNGMLRLAKRESTRVSIKAVLALYVRWAAGDRPVTIEWENVRNIADAAYAYAYADAAYAVYAAAESAASDADAYAYSAAAYASDADADAYAYAYAAAAKKKQYLVMSDKLIELIKKAV